MATSRRRRLVVVLALALLAQLVARSARAQGATPGGATASESAPAAAVPARASYVGVREGANLIGLIQCDKSAVITAAAAASTQIVALSGSTLIYVCGWSVTGGGAAGTLQWKYGTGAACATGPTNISGAYTTAIGQPIVFGGALGYVFKTPAGQALCVTMITASAVANGLLTYAQF